METLRRPFGRSVVIRRRLQEEVESGSDRNFNNPILIHEWEIDTALAASNQHSAPADDGITYVHLRKLIQNKRILRLMCDAFNFWVNNGLPPSLKRATVIPIPKGSDPSKGYRPISLLSCLVKVLERVITKRLRRQYDHLIPTNQSGCMAGCSTIDPLVRLLHASGMSQYRHNLEIKDSESYFCVLFVDFSKA